MQLEGKCSYIPVVNTPTGRCGMKRFDDGNDDDDDDDDDTVDQ